MKIDINSSFVLTPMVYKTHLNSAFKTYNKRLDLDNNKNPYLALIKVPTHKLKVVDDRYPNWLTITTKRWNKKKVPYIPITNITWEDIKFTYGLTKDDVEVVSYVEGRWNYYSCYQQQVYLKEHENKAYYKQHHMKYEKQISKTATYSMHGNALNNQITNEANEDYYKYRKSTPCLKDHPADGFLTSFDATLMYENARHHLLRLINLFDTIYYYDTDCVVVPNTKENKLRVEEYNNWINHFPTHTIDTLSEDVDFSKPMACELYFDHGKRYDVHNFIKPMLDMIARANGEDDKNIRKVSCVTNELVDDHWKEGKIYIKLYNIELD